MTVPDYRGALTLLGAIAANVELVDDGHQTSCQAFDRIRELLATSNHFEAIRPTDSGRLRVDGQDE